MRVRPHHVPDPLQQARAVLVGILATVMVVVWSAVLMLVVALGVHVVVAVVLDRVSLSNGSGTISSSRYL
jgi:hypothetical protein